MKYDWVLEFDIKSLFDNIAHDLLIKAVDKHNPEKWLRLYITRWLTVPVVMASGECSERTQGVPQGGIISPLLANLFLHNVFDKWLKKNPPGLPWCRYADDRLLQS